MLLTTFTIFHVLLSVIGIVSGFVTLLGLLTSRRLSGWTTLFLTTTVATSVTGFLFPFHRFLPSYGVGIVSLLVLAIAIPAHRQFQLNGTWRKTYVISAAIALYLNVFVLVAQMFQKVAVLKALAPTQSEPPFAIAQTLVLLLFVLLAIRATITFHPVLVPVKSHVAIA